MKIWKGIYFAVRKRDRILRKSWVERNEGSISARLERFVGHPVLVDRLKILVLDSQGKSGSPNPRNTLELIERTLETLHESGRADRESIESMATRLEKLDSRGQELYEGIRKEAAG